MAGYALRFIFNSFEQSIDFAGSHLSYICPISDYNRTQSASPQTIDRLQGVLLVSAGLSGLDTELGLQTVEHLHRPPHMTGGPGADLDLVASLWLKTEGAVKCGDAVDLAQWDVQSLADQDEHIPGQVSVPALDRF